MTTSAETPPADGVADLVSEATADAAAVMRSQELAESFEAPAPAPVHPPPPQPPPSISYHERHDVPWARPAPLRTPAAARADPPLASSSTKWQPRTLEDLYAKFPIGDGSDTYKLRVIRLSPTRFGGFYVQGNLGDFRERISMDQFVQRFGGEKYEVLVMGPPAGREMTAGIDFETKASLQLLVPGRVNLDSLPVSEEEFPMMSQRTGYGGRALVDDHPNVRMKELDIAERERQRADEERRSLAERVLEQSRPQESVIQAAVSQANTTVELLREQAVSQRLRIDELMKENGQLRERVIKAEADASKSVLINETEKTRELETRYQAQLAQLKEAHAREITELKDRFAKEQAELRDRVAKELSEVKERAAKDLQDAQTRSRDDLERQRVMYQDRLDQATREQVTKLQDKDGERTRYQEEAAKERERLREEMARREAQLKDTHQIQVDSLKTTFEARIHDLERSSAREAAALRETRDREVQAVKDQYASQAAFSKETTAFKIDTSANEMARLRDEVRKLEREADELRAQVHKPFMQQLQEAKETASILGLEEPTEKGAEEGPFDWKKTIATGVQELLKNAPEMLDKVKEMRAQGAQHVVAMRAAAQGPGAPPPSGPVSMARRRPPPPPSLMAPTAAPAARWQNPPAPWAPPQHIPPAYQGPPPPPTPMGIQAQPTAVISPEQRAMERNAVPPVAGTETEFRMIPSPLNEPRQPSAPNAVHAPLAGPPGWGFPPLQATTGESPVSVPAPVSAAAQPQAASWDPIGGRPINPQPQAAAAVDVAEIPAQQIEAFVGHLDQVIATGLMTARQFAEAIVAQLGAQATAQVVGAISADHFIELVTRHPEGQKSAIVTRTGQKFVRSVWEEAMNILANQAA